MSWQENMKKWLDYSELEPELKSQLNELKDNDEQAEEAFYAPMEFGTAGMRGVLGPGINRMNIYTVRQAAEGLALFMDTLDDETKGRGVAISFDSRYHSQDFAIESAKVLGAHGIKSYVFDSLRPTPELSFAVRTLHTYAGIMITASHNPKQYNGFKIYGPDGGQMPPVESDKITEYVRKADDLFAIKVKTVYQLREEKLMSLIGEDVDQLYLKQLDTVVVNHDLIKDVGRKMKFVYSPLHGTGKMIAPRIFQDLGFENFNMVKEQAILDPEFATTPFPNPEFAQTFDLAIALGKKIEANILIATDPDADRLGAAVRQPDGSYKLMTGNQIASVLLNYLLQAKKETNTLPENGAVVKSIVSTELATAIANKYNVKMYDVLTGFKYIAEKIQNFQDTNSHEFLFGFEESYGYLVKPFVRDKDAMQSTILLAEAAAYYESKGKTIYDALEDLYQEFGYYREKTISKTFDGVSGKERMAAMMKEFREEGISEINGVKVVESLDYLSKTDTKDGKVTDTGLPKADALKFILEDGTWVAVRPSGTEPKMKFYIGITSDTDDNAAKKLEGFAKEVNTWE
ncbi:phospho-sugar mutase [Companilactobacillus sp.]|jgi:phosphoglucomutase|uniref:phospho-sugar mutase n=1 Tax=Companilactobacillus sp. TaxID=2767905 RepID=UPI0025BF5E51|nr:phospho-sugar mutase [Companilactobacillus sp.]MCH4008788.1 phospho-sugar mutase [Companilactobacillus sp.]MCH4051033.1 phospho-sugar mutase [Companilactobacillus sp.]MCH4076731.1 phospho-sugar mutase [Companilactobacillus sp.]MCH4125306.1 phospho-sugar mutase [Companilactobacillus sp.]MCH4131846.1 phospho-sugar mutase [Companilactobacillus sp.]